MSSQVISWNAIRPVPVIKNGIVEPEATDKFPDRPWLRWPPGAAFLVIACAAMLFMAAFQTSMAVVRSEGLSGGIADVEANLQDTLPIPIPLPSFVRAAKPALAAASTDGAPATSTHRRHAHHKRSVKLHRLLQQNGGTTNATSWSHDADADPAAAAAPAN